MGTQTQVYLILKFRLLTDIIIFPKGWQTPAYGPVHTILMRGAELHLILKAPSLSAMAQLMLLNCGIGEDS